MSTSLIAVFIPILLMGGIVGRIFREFAITLSVAVAISMVVSLTTTPMMCAKLLKPARQDDASTTGSTAPAKRGFDCDGRRLRQQPALGAAASAARCWASLLGTVCLAVYLYIVVPKGFFPQQDTGRLSGNAVAARIFPFKR